MQSLTPRGRWVLPHARPLILLRRTHGLSFFCVSRRTQGLSPFFYMSLAFAAFYDALVFSVLPDAVSYIGAGLIVTAAAILVWREARPNRF